jgi:hypothetical protein
VNDELRELLACVLGAQSNPSEGIMPRREYKHLFTLPGIERDSELAVKLVNERMRKAWVG